MYIYLLILELGFKRLFGYKPYEHNRSVDSKTGAPTYIGKRRTVWYLLGSVCRGNFFIY